MYLDALFLNLRKNIVKKKTLHIALCIDLDGKK
ncbi:MAG: hypothetical protein ACP5IB_07535 [Thermoplasmata archaeon]